VRVGPRPTLVPPEDDEKCEEVDGETCFTVEASGTNGTPSWEFVNQGCADALTDTDGWSVEVCFDSSNCTADELSAGADVKVTVTADDPLCPSPSAEANVRVGPRPTASVDDQAACADSDIEALACGLPTTFEVTGTCTNGDPSWTLVSGPACLTWSADGCSIDVTFPAECSGDAVFELTVTGDPLCPPAVDTATVQVFPNPDCDISGDFSDLCFGETRTWTGPAGMDHYIWTLGTDPPTVLNTMGTGQSLDNVGEDVAGNDLPEGTHTYCLYVGLDYTDVNGNTFTCWCKCCQPITIIRCNEACSPGYWRSIHKQDDPTVPRHGDEWCIADMQPLDNWCESTCNGCVDGCADGDDPGDACGDATTYAEAFGLGTTCADPAIQTFINSDDNTLLDALWVSSDNLLFHCGAAMLDASHDSVSGGSTVEELQLLLQGVCSGADRDTVAQFCTWLISLEDIGGCPLD
jgi:hypothetical protein